MDAYLIAGGPQFAERHGAGIAEDVELEGASILGRWGLKTNAFAMLNACAAVMLKAWTHRRPRVAVRVCPVHVRLALRRGHKRQRAMLGSRADAVEDDDAQRVR